MDDLPEPGALLVESLDPEPGAFERRAAARGEPGLPLAFAWRGRSWRIASVERRWKSMGRDHGGSREMYVRRHWAVIRTTDGLRMRIYGERGGLAKRWWIHSLEPARPDRPE